MSCLSMQAVTIILSRQIKYHYLLAVVFIDYKSSFFNFLIPNHDINAIHTNKIIFASSPVLAVDVFFCFFIIFVCRCYNLILRLFLDGVSSFGGSSFLVEVSTFLDYSLFFLNLSQLHLFFLLKHHDYLQHFGLL